MERWYEFFVLVRFGFKIKPPWTSSHLQPWSLSSHNHQSPGCSPVCWSWKGCGPGCKVEGQFKRWCNSWFWLGIMTDGNRTTVPVLVEEEEETSGHIWNLVHIPCPHGELSGGGSAHWVVSDYVPVAVCWPSSRLMVLIVASNPPTSAVLTRPWLEATGLIYDPPIRGPSDKNILYGR